jgi:hypothetical protein
MKHQEIEKKYNHVVCVCFSLDSESEDPIKDRKLLEMFKAARSRLDDLERVGEVEGFDIVETIENEKETVVNTFNHKVKQW